MAKNKVSANHVGCTIGSNDIPVNALNIAPTQSLMPSKYAKSSLPVLAGYRFKSKNTLCSKTAGRKNHRAFLNKE